MKATGDAGPGYAGRVFTVRMLQVLFITLALMAQAFMGVGTASAASIGTYDQCSNDDGDGYASGDTGCRWTNGNLQSNNSTYIEGDATVQRLWLTGLEPGSNHEITLKYGTTKGGTHAYDFLTTWDWSEDLISDADRCQDIDGCDAASTETKLGIPEDPNVPGTFEPSAAGNRQFVMRGGTLDSATTPYVESGAYTGDSETVITIAFTVGPGSGAMCSTKQGVTTCGVALWFGAHVARTADWVPVDGQTGAGGIEGSPYHVAFDALDGDAVGQRDNQMQANAIVANGTIVIVKDAVPNDAQDFSFNLTNGTTVSQDFSLDDDANATLPNSRTFTVPPGTWTASELNIPTGWDLTSIVCVDPTGNTTVNLSNATASINLASSETVTCTFSNIRVYNQPLAVSKSATATYNRTYGWLIDKSVDQTEISIADGVATFNYSVAVTPNGSTDSGWSLLGKITLTNPNDVAFTGVNVTDAADVGGGASCAVSGGTNVTVPANGSVELDYSCAFTGLPSYSGENTATATWDTATNNTESGSASGEAAVSFALSGETNRTITVVDDKTNTGNPVTLGTRNWADGQHTFTYALQKPGVDGECTSYTNIATIDETDQTDSQTVKVCVPTISKTAAGTYDERHEWDVEKSVTPVSQDAFAGATANFDWTVVVSESVFPENFAVTGTISVVNPAAATITVDLTDALNDGTTATIGSCTNGSFANGELTVAAGSTAVCGYSANPSGQTATLNTASLTLNGATITASDTVEWAATVIRGSATLDDTLKADWPINLTDGGSFNYSTNYVCSTNAGAYTNGSYTHEVGNTAVVTSGDERDRDDASASVTCYAPLVSKTAAGSYSETHSWDVTKTASPTSQKAFIGATVSYEWTVGVTEQVSESNFSVAGTISVANPNPSAEMTVGLLDNINGTSATISGCTGGSWDSGSSSVTVPAGGIAICSYAAAPSNRTTSVNTATATLNGLSVTATDPIEWTANVVNGSVSLDDDQNPAFPLPISDGGTWQYSEQYTCSTDKSAYDGTTHKYSFGESNTAALRAGDTTLDSASASVAVECYVPVVSKTASAEWKKKYEWTITKTATPETHTGFAGAGFTSDYDVVVDQTVTDYAFRAFGTISVTNPAGSPGSITVSVADAVEGMAATLDCGGTLTVAAGATGSCGYAVNLPNNTDRTNTATMTFNAIDFTATAAVDFGDPIVEGNPTVNVTDTVQGALGAASGDRTFEYSRNFSCSTNPGSYTNGVDTDTFPNTATITETGQTANETVTTTCYAPVVTKTATTYFNRDWDWTITKDYDATYNLLAGGTIAHGYKVKVTPTHTDNLWGVSGTITVANNHPSAPMTLASLTDLAGGISATVTCPTLVVPAGGSLSCTYNTGPRNSPNSNPFGATNTATAAFGGANWTGSAAIAFSATPTTEDQPVITLDDDKLTGENWSANRAIAEWTYPKNFACSRNLADYTSGKYSYSLTNTAKINETNQTDTAKVDVNCYWPQINIAKLTNGQIDTSRAWQFQLFAGPHASDTATGWLASPLATDSSQVAGTGVLDFDNYVLDPTKSYTFCERDVPAGWYTRWTFGGNLITPYNPDRAPTGSYPNGQDLGTRCFDFGVGTSYPISTTGGTITFQIDNRNPTGDPRTIGYWKNWSSCSGGNQYQKAQERGGKAKGYWTIDDVLPITIGTYLIDSCQKAVSLLDKSEVGPGGKKMANDAAYGLAAQLIAAKANVAADARPASGLSGKIAAADALLTRIGFVGTGEFLGSKVKGTALADRNEALALADWLDKYNNGLQP